MARGEIGFVGLGIMGKPMVRNLMKADYSVTVYDIVSESVEEMVTDGAKSASTAAEVAQSAPIVITMVPDSPQSEAAILGPNGVLEGASSGSTVIDMSSIAPASSQKIAKACENAGVNFLDAPVSGGETGAIEATLAVMVGGKKEVFDSNYDMLSTMSGSIVLCGDYGAGNTTKLANQIIVAGNIAALGEALVLAKKSGIDPQVVFDAIKGGLAGSTVMNTKGPMMINGNFDPGFRIVLHQKDLHNALLTGKDVGAPLMFTSLAQQILGSLINDGKGNSDHSAIANFMEDMAGVKISDK
ncbi:MAG: 2-hydroxy-3-oxopropionate reductase [SAR202 cluster bacterium]|nr:2-hydroxy-3-oxopropionate reductase [SAR202 cluster bacterium]|tara:strand:- start:300 stop:1196 length:897 start_codon:yes stop_codon:yes gene_type:complete